MVSGASSVQATEKLSSTIPLQTTQNVGGRKYDVIICGEYHYSCRLILEAYLCERVNHAARNVIIHSEHSLLTH